MTPWQFKKLQLSKMTTNVNKNKSIMKMTMTVQLFQQDQKWPKFDQKRAKKI